MRSIFAGEYQIPCYTHSMRYDFLYTHIWQIFPFLDLFFLLYLENVTFFPSCATQIRNRLGSTLQQIEKQSGCSKMVARSMMKMLPLVIVLLADNQHSSHLQAAFPMLENPNGSSSPSMNCCLENWAQLQRQQLEKKNLVESHLDPRWNKDLPTALSSTSKKQAAIHFHFWTCPFLLQ